MTVNAVRPDVERELSRLKDFQRATVSHVVDRLWAPTDAAKRFLVADEVGLGKTMVARGVIARTIDLLWDVEDRIDVVYICSNSQIARQNLGRLALDGFSVDHADRLTMLPEAMKGLRSNKVNFISFTPGTSFQIHESGGKAGERVLLQRMLAKAWGPEVRQSKAHLQFFRGRVSLENYSACVKEYDDSRFDQALALRFGQDVEHAVAYTGRALSEEFDEALDAFRYTRGDVPYQLSRHRYRLIGQMRNLVARAAVESLEPDLVILDEFQRFKDLLQPGEPGADLAHAIFDQPSSKVLLLSATPYKMYTLPDEAEGDDHYEDFRRTVEFLGGDEEAAAVMASLRGLREALLDGPRLDDARAAKAAAEARLRRLMCRTERLRSTSDLDGMLKEVACTSTTPSADDLRAYVGAARVAQSLGSGDHLEYWRSSPYSFNIMEDYKVKQELRARLSAPPPDLLAALQSCPGLLDWRQLDAYGALDAGNAKMRGLIGDVVDRGAWRLLWLPPALPYYAPSGPYTDPGLQAFTKRLVFSAWNVVPKAIGVVLSYEAERRALLAAEGTARRAYSADRPTGPLRFQVDATGRPTGMPVLALLYPSVVLARTGDPLAHARQTGELPASAGELKGTVASRLRAALADLPAGPSGGPEDQRWYWAAPLLLDEQAGVPRGPFLDLLRTWGDEDADTETRLQRHVEEAMALDPSALGRRPDDLIAVLTSLAVAGPGTASLRALSRVCSESDTEWEDPAFRSWAADLAWGLRTLFNRPESVAVVRGETGEDVYWRAALQYCFAGNLQAVLDEYVHVLVDAEGLQDVAGLERAARLGDAFDAAVSLRATRAAVDDLQADDQSVTLHSHNARLHFAARFGRSQTDDQQMQREGQVREAYNSPFWPFVLASTSVGQEGLDFHSYSHAVVHWNLPGNPVDLEQREGRVHRFKGHAIRRNVARTHGRAALEDVGDPWSAVFAAAQRDAGGDSELTPFWVYAPDGGAHIERYVPASPLSREAARYRRLLRTVGAYRLVMGQTRQEDLLHYLGETAQELDWLRIDLTPAPAEGAPS